MRGSRIIVSLGFLITGCATTKQIVPGPFVLSPTAQQVRIVIQGGRKIYPPLVINDGTRKIGQIGQKGSLIWDRAAGRCNLEAVYTASAMVGQSAGRACVFSADLQGGRQYTFGLEKLNGVLTFQPSPESNTGIAPVKVPVCILPVVDATGGKGIDLGKYAEAYKLPKNKNGSYFPANWAFRELSQWGYTKPFYGGEQMDPQKIYAAAKQGSVSKQMLLENGNSSYYLLVVVHKFDDAFRIIWLADSTVECYLIRAADGKVVYRGTGSGTGRGRTLDADKRVFIVAYRFPELSDGDAWQQAVWEATYNAVKEMPILTP